MKLSHREEKIEVLTYTPLPKWHPDCLLRIVYLRTVCRRFLEGTLKVFWFIESRLFTSELPQQGFFVSFKSL
jgi:hypothetical protein